MMFSILAVSRHLCQLIALIAINGKTQSKDDCDNDGMGIEYENVFCVLIERNFYHYLFCIFEGRIQQEALAVLEYLGCIFPRMIPHGYFTFRDPAATSHGCIFLSV